MAPEHKHREVINRLVKLNYEHKQSPVSAEEFSYLIDVLEVAYGLYPQPVEGDYPPEPDFEG